MHYYIMFLQHQQQFDEDKQIILNINTVDFFSPLKITTEFCVLSKIYLNLIGIFYH